MITFTLVHDKRYRYLGKDHLAINITVTGDTGIDISNHMFIDPTDYGHDKRYRFCNPVDTKNVRKITLDTMLAEDNGLCLINGHKEFSNNTETIELTSHIDPNTFFYNLKKMINDYHYSNVRSNCNDLVLNVLKCAGIDLDDLIEYGNCQHLCFCFFDPFGCLKINTTNVVMNAAQEYKSSISNNQLTENTPLLSNSV